jgi:peptidoglycan/xylan/chitin deacetylase (PgdA/CDA1 family)
MAIAKSRSHNSYSRRVIAPAMLVVVLLLTALAVLGSMLPSKNGHQQLTIVLRYDDYSAVSNTYLESQILEELDKHQLPCIFAAIPCVTAHGFRNSQPADSLLMDAEKVAMLKPYIDKGLVELCVHGCTHQTLPNKDLREMSEFEGLTYEQQVARLAHGKSILEEQFQCPIVSFVPPWGNYDDNTIRAVEAVGFSIISADPRGPALKESSLLYVPGTCRIHQLKEAIAEARSLPSSNSALITAVIHPYDFIESDVQRGVMTFQQFKDLLAEISQDPTLRFTTAAGATQLISDLGASRFMQASSLRHSSLNHLIPGPLRMGIPNMTYVDGRLARTLLERERVWCIALYVISFLVIAFIANRIRRFLPSQWMVYRRKALIVGYTVVLIVAAYSLYDLEIYALGLSSIVGLAAYLVGNTID